MKGTDFRLNVSVFTPKEALETAVMSNTIIVTTIPSKNVDLQLKYNWKLLRWNR